MNISLFSIILFLGPIFSQTTPQHMNSATSVVAVWPETCYVVQVGEVECLVSKNYVDCYNLEIITTKEIYFCVERKNDIPFLRSITKEEFQKHSEREKDE